MADAFLTNKQGAAAGCLLMYETFNNSVNDMLCRTSINNDPYKIDLVSIMMAFAVAWHLLPSVVPGGHN